MIRIVALEGTAINALLVTRSVVTRGFDLPIASYVAMSLHGFHGLVAEVQAELNALKMARRFVTGMRGQIAEYMGDADIMFQSKLYLRAARPTNGKDIVGWHRESFYGGPKRTVNFWVPVANVTPDNSLQYIPGSDQVPTSALIVTKELDRNVERGSASHHIGLLPEPITILDGLNFASAKPMLVPDDHAVLFPGELIHGSGANKTHRIRFSIDLRVLPARFEHEAKAGYFERLDA